jgi:hypothetical protein
MRVGRLCGRAGFIVVTALAVTLSQRAIASPVTAQVNDFEGGTTQGWTNGGAAAEPVNTTTGGPAGTGDNFLRVSASGGSGPGSRLTVFNTSSQWAGNYVTPGVNRLEMDLKNFGTTGLRMRIGLEDTSGTRLVSTTPFILPGDNLWHHATFSLDAASFTKTGSATVATALTRVRQLRIFHSVGADYQGDPVAGSIGVDNIRAVPEPAAAGVLAVAALGLLARRRRA